MTQSTILAETQGSNTGKSSLGQTLLAAINRQIRLEKASFHTPGHKGRLVLENDGAVFAADLTELPGLDELSRATGVLALLQERISAIWKSRQSLISVNGASAALTAAIMSCRSRGRHILLPRNAHRSAINALIFSGMEACFYEPEWLEPWGTWGAVELKLFEQALDSNYDKLAACLVCSPSYAGSISNIEKLSDLCHKKQIPLIVDEAHGAHLFSGAGYPKGALDSGADLVVHSLHKTLSAPTQTGVLQIGKNCPISDELLQACLNTLQSSSPSYLLMLGIEQSLNELVDDSSLQNCLRLATKLRIELCQNSEIEILKNEAASETDPLHILCRHKRMSATDFYEALIQHGIYPESVLGQGVLLLLGLRSNETDLLLLNKALNQINKTAAANYQANPLEKPIFTKLVVNPTEAFFAESRLLALKNSPGNISSDWLAPCPPGYPVLVPGQKIEQEIIKFIDPKISIRVIKQPQLEGDSDGPNTAS